MSDINLRIKYLVDVISEGNNSDFAKILDTSETNIRNYIKGTSPKVEFLETLCRKLEINGEWLLTGNGNWKNKKKNSEINKNVNDESDNFIIKNKPHDEQMQMLFDKINELKEEINTIRLRDGMYSEAIAAKLGIDIENHNSENTEKEKSGTN